MPAEAAALEVRAVGVRFGGVTALSGVSLSAFSGQVTGLIGPNGAGKTTLFNVITGLQRPDHGNILMNGQDVARKGPNRRARMGLGRTFQRLELFGSLTAADNVRVAMESFGGSTRASARAVLERVGVGDYASQNVSSLATGSARLVELARALSIDPKVLLLDEPCSGLDEHETLALGELLRSVAAEGRAVILVEHDTELVFRVCSTVYVLDFGEVIASGTPEAIRQNPLVQEAYLGQAQPHDEQVQPAGEVQSADEQAQPAGEAES
jgi:branched-chain amino acid transport system ATP-binding protein